MEKKKTFRIRKARKQISRPLDDDLQREEGLGEYNIWYHKHLGQKGPQKVSLSKTRCSIAKDSGWTRGCGKTQSFFCLQFARGCCYRGEKCKYLHRIPTMSDELKIPLTQDCFGRDKFATDREDMGGVGSFNREGKTIFVQGLKNIQGIDLNETIINNFKEWGELDYVRLNQQRCNCYIKYKNRLNAEFCKESMHGQTLGNGEILNITWADLEEDVMEKNRRIMENRRKMVDVLQKRKEKNSSQPIAKTQSPKLESPAVNTKSTKTGKENDPVYQRFFQQYYKQYFSEYWKQHQNEVKKKESEEAKNNNIEKKSVPQKPEVAPKKKNQNLNYYNYMHREYIKNVELQEQREKEIEENQKKRKRLNSSVVGLYPNTDDQYEPIKKKRKFN